MSVDTMAGRQWTQAPAVRGAAAAGHRRRRRMPGVGGLALRQLGFDLLSQIRNPSTLIFTLALPLLFLVAFTATTEDAAAAAEYYVPAIMVMALASGTLTNLAVTLTYLREYGQLKRILVTPLPRWVYLGSRVMSGGLVAGLTVVALGFIGRLAYDVTPDHPWLLALALTVIFLQGSCLGVALTVFLRSETAAAPLANAISLPLLMASGVFFPLSTLPSWFEDLADYLPFTGVVSAATRAFEGGTDVAEAARDALLVPGLWTVAAVVLALLWFRWAPVKRR